jgi:glycosyltransferase involved in cell wall biosynthesis
MARLFVDGLRGLAELAEIRVIVPASTPYRPGPHCTAIPVEPGPFRFWTHVSFPLLIRKHRPDAVLCLGQTLPRFRPASRYALAVPDAGPLEDLGWPTSSHDAYNRAWLRAMAPRAEAIVTISEFTKGRLASHLGIPRERIHVVQPIRPSRWAQEAGSRSASVRSTGRHPDGDYFLSLGNVEPRKNFPGLIAAYASLKSRRPDAPPLYIAGHKAWGYAETAAAVARYGLQDSVLLTGYLSDADAEAYLAHCTVFVASSLYEGWGLPLFESIAQGKAAIYHEGTSQEEFARGAALAVDCRDAGRLASAMEMLWASPTERERLQASAKQRSAELSGYDLEGALKAALTPLLTPLPA